MYKMRIITQEEENDCNVRMETCHPLGNPKLTGHRLKYAVFKKDKMIAIMYFSACSWHLADRDRWIGWSEEQALQRRHFVVQNSRFLILPHEGDHIYNLASRVLADCARRISVDWQEHFGYPVLLMETFTDPVKHKGTCYKASGWDMVGTTKGFRRDGTDFYAKDSTPKHIWLKQLRPDARELLNASQMPDEFRVHEKPLPHKAVGKRIDLDGMHTLFEIFKKLPDARRTQGRRHSQACCLAVLLCSVLAGCKGVRECAEFAKSLTQAQLRSLRAWRNRKTGKHLPPSAATLWRTAQAMDAEAFETAANEWFNSMGVAPEAIALDGKALRGTLLNENGGDCAVSAIAHDSNGKPFFLNKFSLTQKEKKLPQPRI